MLVQHEGGCCTSGGLAYTSSEETISTLSGADGARLRQQWQPIDQVAVPTPRRQLNAQSDPRGRGKAFRGQPGYENGGFRFSNGREGTWENGPC